MTKAQKIDGKAFAAKTREKVGQYVKQLKDGKKIIPGLAVVLVGGDPASEIYVRSKKKYALEAGMNSFEYKLDADTTQNELLELVTRLNNDSSVHGILVQLPLPDHIDTDVVLKTIDVAKDVDGFHPANVGLNVTTGKGMVPCTPLGCLAMLKETLGEMSGKKAIVVGRSNIVGKPMAHLLLAENCTVTIAHSRTRDLAGECRAADIVVAAVGRPEMIKGDWIKDGATVIDVGINRIPKEPEELKDDGTPKTRLVGDVCFEEAAQKAYAITPVPGGVGPMTIAMLLRNTYVACLRQNGLSEPGDI